ncbi:MAG: Ig-like domain-containing protein [Bacteroidetes bacterium]|nr:Ig-like domain-containing protein [Bacteroidota bacterium]
MLIKFQGKNKTAAKMYRIIKNNFRLCLLAVHLLLVFSCAQIVAPGGGKKDTTAPTVLKYSPDSATLNFTAKTIEINFDEYIQLKDLNNQLIISPLLSKTPDIDVKGKTLIVEFDKDEVLKPNTTYCISFGNAVTDVNEGNPIENFQYIFSTGTFIDSLKVKGKVQSAFDHKTEKGLLVMLYSDLTDSVIYKSQPDYFAKTKADGSFEINNVKNGTYKIVAIKDANANYKYDVENESIAFTDSLVNPSDKKTINLELFQEPAKKVFLKKATHPSYGRFDFVFSQGSDSIRINNLSNDLKGVQEYVEFSKNKDSLSYWVTNYQKDSIVFQLSNGNQIIDTLEFKFINKEDALKAKRNPLKLSVIASLDGSQSFDLNKNVILDFSNPIKSIPKTNGTQIKMDSSKIAGAEIEFVIFNNFRTTVNTIISDSVTKNSSWKENTNYQLYIPPNTFTDIFDLTNDTITVDFKTRELKYYGTLKLNISIPETKNNYVVQLIDEQGNVTREHFIKKSEVLNYDYLQPKKYKLKIIVDNNNNQKWDTGNYIQHLQAEKVIFNSELINVRSNWDMELDWKVQ